jgi:putative transposase
VRYIHLNPLRAGIVRDLKALDSYAHTGHATLMGKQEVVWQDCGQILRYFASKKTSARKNTGNLLKKAQIWVEGRTWSVAA